MLYSKPELNQIGSAEQLILADAPHAGQDSDSSGTAYPYKLIAEDEFAM